MGDRAAEPRDARALLYDQRVFQPFDKDGDVAVYQPKQSVAKRIQSGGSTIRR